MVMVAGLTLPQRDPNGFAFAADRAVPRVVVARASGPAQAATIRATDARPQTMQESPAELSSGTEHRKRLPSKKSVMLKLLDMPSVDIHLDPRRVGVLVPPRFKKQPHLALRVGRHAPIPIPDINVQNDFVSFTLSFAGSPFLCHLPWSSIFALVGSDGNGMLWPEDLPPELRKQPPSAYGGSVTP